MDHNEDSEYDSDKTEEIFSLWSDHHKLVNRNWKNNKCKEFV